VEVGKNQNKMTIEDWILGLTHNQESLSNLPICPYAKKAYINKRYQIVDTDYNTIDLDIEHVDLIKYQVIIFKLADYQSYDIEYLKEKTSKLNEKFNKDDIIILEIFNHKQAHVFLELDIDKKIFKTKNFNA
jgi:hypothetical protein